MTTAELIDRLRSADPDGTREVGMFIDHTNTSIGHVRLHDYSPGLVVIGWDTGDASGSEDQRREGGR